MRYATGEEMAVGDVVIADGMNGVIVRDFDNRRFASGYEGWNVSTVGMLDGSILASGVMVNTQEAGLVHYRSENDGIRRAC